MSNSRQLKKSFLNRCSGLTLKRFQSSNCGALRGIEMFVPECMVPGCALSLLSLGTLVGLPLSSFYSGLGQCSRELGCTSCILILCIHLR